MFKITATHVKLKKLTKIMEIGLEQWHPSSRFDKDAGFSVSWIIACLSGVGIKRREPENYTVPTEISGTVFFPFSSYKEHG